MMTRCVLSTVMGEELLREIWRLLPTAQNPSPTRFRFPTWRSRTEVTRLTATGSSPFSHGCVSASFAVSRLSGSYVSIPLINSSAAFDGRAFAKRVGSSLYSLSGSECFSCGHNGRSANPGHIRTDGVPNNSQINSSCFVSMLAGINGLCSKSSPSIQPTDQISIGGP